MKKAPLRPDRSKSVARWENEGGAGTSPPKEERGADGTRDEKERPRIRKPSPKNHVIATATARQSVPQDHRQAGRSGQPVNRSRRAGV